MTTVRALIGTAVKKGWQMFQLDVNNAFLHGDLHEEVYMQIPQGLAVDKPGLVCKLNKSLYGLKQARTHQEEIDSLKSFLHETFKIKDLGRLHYFLGMEVLYKGDGVLISQRKFTMDLLKEFVCTKYSSLSSPLDPSTKLKADESPLLADPSNYRKLVGKLNFLTNTRLDISFSIQHLSQYMQSPRESHLKAAYHVLRYLKGDPSLGIFFSNSKDYGVKAFCDLDWEACPETRKSVSGYIVLLGNSPISWKSKKQSTISLSSAEAEYRAARQVVGELVWLVTLLEELTVPVNLPIPVFCDSQAALQIARNPVFHERTKHIEVDCHFVRTKLQEGLILYTMFPPMSSSQTSSPSP
ncbi:PREDICTED: uncharacterized protein LOC109222580 [Nicotiana attenuata]|uniref:uncharacterized protein LOC109222580 n=1 Tax=Nicotiana attenuata TaxID=49451 RepID=UPI0009046DE0|nr:PREDICTED: uncharacterized protein LOC109222580 [Nicotiana attenuata]